MGNQIPIDKSKNYDIVFHIENMSDAKIGWPIHCNDPQTRNDFFPKINMQQVEGNNNRVVNDFKDAFDEKKWNSQIVSIQGQYNTG